MIYISLAIQSYKFDAFKLKYAVYKFHIDIYMNANAPKPIKLEVCQYNE